ncbi:isochorismate synthase [Bacteroides sp.]
MNSILDINFEEVVAHKQSFILFRKPDSDVLYVGWSYKDCNQTFQHLNELNGQSGYVIAPFRADENHPIVLIPIDDFFGCSLPKGIENLPPLKDNAIEQTGVDEEYAQRFEVFVRQLRDKVFDKLVLSRSVERQDVEFNDVAKAFSYAFNRYPHSYVYMLYTPQTGLWVGSTPEIMLQSKGDVIWSTVALAGTQPLLRGGKLPQRWSAKQRKEQEYVAAYIRRQLESMDIKSLEKGPYPTYAGALSHLKTDFYFLKPDEDKIGDLLSLLHPTPAVCGLPKEEAYRFILENEGYDRSYYSGFVGLLDPKEKPDLYVNLRCMNMQDGKLTLYAGGGLLASSELNDEFQETEKKMQTMKGVI